MRYWPSAHLLSSLYSRIERRLSFCISYFSFLCSPLLSSLPPPPPFPYPTGYKPPQIPQGLSHPQEREGLFFANTAGKQRGFVPKTVRGKILFWALNIEISHHLGRKVLTPKVVGLLFQSPFPSALPIWMWVKRVGPFPFLSAASARWRQTTEGCTKWRCSSK